MKKVLSICDPGLFERLCRRLIQDQLAFMLPPERGLVFGVSQFQRHRPELLVGGEVFYQQRHIPKAAFRVFQGGGRRVVCRADLGQPAFQALVAVDLVFCDEV